MNSKRFLSLKLENCYGIRSMEEKLEFGDGNNRIMIYASNGVMKTSLTKTLDKVSKGQLPKDEVFNKNTKFTITYLNTVNEQDLNNQNPLNNVFVIHSLNNVNDFAIASSNLLVNENARRKYTEIHNQINNRVTEFKSKLKKITGGECWNNFRSFFENYHGKTLNDEALMIISELFLENSTDNHYEKHKYKELFNEQTDKLFNSKEFIDNVGEYTCLYNKLINESDVFSSTGFDPQQADGVLNQLKKSNFFKANHKIIINGYTINNENELKSILTQEKRKILSDESLAEKFLIIEKLISNINARKFRDIIKANPDYVPLLISKKKFEEDYWLSTLHKLKEEIININIIIDQNKDTLIKIREEALNDYTEWQKVVDEYNSRFNVPFELVINNKEDVILNLDLPVIDFKYKDKITGEETLKKYENLQDILSNGEKRALYFLNIIFKIESLKSQSGNKLLVFDDIADSFDYKNKYAIIQYIKDISYIKTFDIVVLTHNYDFYRTLFSRIPINRNNSFIARINNVNEVVLNSNQKGSETLYLGNIFKEWIQQFKKQNNEMVMIASITFFRNLLEYRYIDNNDSFNLLTSLLHIKKLTYTIKWDDIFKIVNEIVPEVSPQPLNSCLGSKCVMHSIFERADEAVKASKKSLKTHSNLENKVVLSMAIRLKTEIRALKILKLPYGDFGKNQTYKLYKSIQDSGYVFSSDEKEMFEKVMIITPEHIHLNSFMFEPLIDTSIESLVELYEVCKVFESKEVSV